MPVVKFDFDDDDLDTTKPMKKASAVQPPVATAPGFAPARQAVSTSLSPSDGNRALAVQRAMQALRPTEGPGRQSDASAAGNRSKLVDRLRNPAAPGQTTQSRTQTTQVIQTPEEEAPAESVPVVDHTQKLRATQAQAPFRATAASTRRDMGGGTGAFLQEGPDMKATGAVQIQKAELDELRSEMKGLQTTLQTLQKDNSYLRGVLIARQGGSLPVDLLLGTKSSPMMEALVPKITPGVQVWKVDEAPAPVSPSANRTPVKRAPMENGLSCGPLAPAQNNSILDGFFSSCMKQQVDHQAPKYPEQRAPATPTASTAAPSPLTAGFEGHSGTSPFSTSQLPSPLIREPPMQQTWGAGDSKAPPYPSYQENLIDRPVRAPSFASPSEVNNGDFGAQDPWRRGSLVLPFPDAPLHAGPRGAQSPSWQGSPLSPMSSMSPMSPSAAATLW